MMSIKNIRMKKQKKNKLINMAGIFYAEKNKSSN